MLPLLDLVQMLPANDMIIHEIDTRDPYSFIEAKMIILSIVESQKITLSVEIQIIFSCLELHPRKRFRSSFDNLGFFS